jgi:hypothetical protein
VIIKLFDNFNKEDDNDHFNGIDISDMRTFDFIWTNRPFISDYINRLGVSGPAEKRIIISKLIRNYIAENNIDKHKFKEILEEEGFKISRESDNGYSFKITTPQHFFDILKSLKYLI